MRVSNSSWAASISGVPLAFAPKRKFSPTETSTAPSLPASTSVQKASGSTEANSSSKGITISSSTPSPSITSRLTANGMINFGTASGWITVIGCGSKVTTVSASPITSRWPTWTPSKVPIATRRARRSASGRFVTSMLIWPSPRRTLSREHDLGLQDLALRAGDRQQAPLGRQPQRAGGLLPTGLELDPVDDVEGLLGGEL